MKKVFIDGQAGTTGLQIHQRLAQRKDIELFFLPEERRKDPAARQEALNQADVAFLCLPDAAAREAVALVENPETVIIDTSTAHRTDPAWTYGFPELSPQHKQAIRQAKRIANPGCHATGFISIVYPLVASGLLPEQTQLTCFSLTGYSGGGKKMIAQYEEEKTPAMESPALYGLGQEHKHLPEMQKLCGLQTAPVFCPIVDDYYKGMATTVPLQSSWLREPVSPEQLKTVLRDWYGEQPLIRVLSAEEAAIDGRLYAGTMAGKDALEVIVSGNSQRITVTARFDNLGKGASGAAVQNMNLRLGLGEYEGLEL